MRRILLLHNPLAGGRGSAGRLGAVHRALAAAGVRVEEAPCREPGDSAAWAREAAEQRRVDALFVFGGDGTVRAVASGLRGSDLPLGILPGGTTNVVAGALALPRHPARAATALLAGRTRPLDLGLCGGAPFLMQATAGLDAQVMRRVDPRLKRRLGKAAVIWAGILEWSRYRFPEIRIEIDGRLEVVTAVAICNLPEYAGGFRLVPHGCPDDRRLEVLLFRGHRRRDALGFALALAAGRHAARRDVEIRGVEEANLLGPPGTALQVDGDPWPAELPLRFGLASDRLLVLVPGPDPR